VVVRMNRLFAPQRCPRNLRTTVGDHLVDVHVELRTASGHPDVERKHVVMLAGEDLVANLNDQLVGLRTESPSREVRVGRRFFENRVGVDHLSWNEVRSDTEVLQRSLRLRAPKLVGGNTDFSEAT